MTSPLDKIKSAVLGVPVDPNKKPSRTGIVQAFSEMQTLVDGAAMGALIKNSLAALITTVTAPSAGAMAWVIGDSTPANNGIYENTGTTSAAVWARRADIPIGMITAINVGAGTANAIQVTTDLPVPSADGKCIVALPIVATNTSATVTISINGGVALTVSRNYGTALAVGDLVAGVFYLGVVAGGQFRLINPARDVVETIPPDSSITAAKLATDAINDKLGYVPANAASIAGVTATELGLTGSGDEATALAAAIVTAAGRWIDLQGKTITCGSTVTPTVALRIRNGGLRFTNTGNGIAPTGTLGAAKVPTGTLSAGASVISFASSPNIAPGALIFIISDDVWSSALELGGTGQGGVRSQWATVKSVAGNNLTLNCVLDYSFTTNIRVYAPSMIDGIEFESVKFEGLGLDNNQKLFVPFYCKNIRMINCIGVKSGHSISEMFRCYNVVGFCNTFNTVVGTGLAYGVSLDGGCENVYFSATNSYDLRHAFTSGGTAGVNRRITIDGLMASGSKDAPIDTHFSSDLCAFNNINATMGAGITQEVVMMEGSRISVTNLKVNGASGAVAWQPFTDMIDDWCILDGYISGAQAGSSQPMFLLDNRKIAGNIKSFRVTGRGEQLQSGNGVTILNPSVTNIENVTIDVDIKVAQRCVRINASSTGTIKKIKLNGSYETTSTGVENIYLEGVTNGLIDDVIIDSRVIGGQYGVRNVSNNVTNLRVSNLKSMIGQPTGQMFLGTVGANANKSTGVFATDATVTVVTGVDPNDILHTGTLTANRDINLSPFNVYDGAVFRVTRTGSGAFTLSVRLPASTVLKSLSTNQWCDVVYSATAGTWRLSAYGTL